MCLLNYRKDSTPFWNHLSLSPVLDPEGRCSHYIGIQQDITQQRAQQDLNRPGYSGDLFV